MKRIMLVMAAAAAIISTASCGRKDKGAEVDPELADSLAVVDPTALSWSKVSPEDFEFAPVSRFANDWMVLSVGDSKDMNAMTISWGGIGQLWNKPVVTVYVSQDRYTKKMMDGCTYFTLTAFPEGRKYKEALLYLGSHSRKDSPDKVAESGLTVEYTSLGNPTYSEGNLVIECKKLYQGRFNEEQIPDDIRESIYTQTGEHTQADAHTRLGMHTMYIGEIVAIYTK